MKMKPFDNTFILTTMVNLKILFVSFKILGTTKGSQWGYDFHNGPRKWGGLCRSGTNQSPINLNTQYIKYTSQIAPIRFVNYESTGSIEIRNIGHTVKISGFEKWGPKKQPYISGGGLNGRYRLIQIHLHWSSDGSNGSEHAIDGEHYLAELHMVHVRNGLSFSEALLHPDGLAVVAIFLELGIDRAPFKTLEKSFSSITALDTTIKLRNYRVGTLLPKNLENFYRYEGSLTTPGCDEAVVWTVLEEPITITHRQFSLLRNLRANRKGNLLIANNRPIQPRNGRPVYYRVGRKEPRRWRRPLQRSKATLYDDDDDTDDDFPLVPSLKQSAIEDAHKWWADDDYFADDNYCEEYYGDNDYYEYEDSYEDDYPSSHYPYFSMYDDDSFDEDDVLQYYNEKKKERQRKNTLKKSLY